MTTPLTNAATKQVRQALADVRRSIEGMWLTAAMEQKPALNSAMASVTAAIAALNAVAEKEN